MGETKKIIENDFYDFMLSCWVKVLVLRDG